MKRVLFMAIAVLLMAAPAANAQKVNESGIRQKLEKSDAEINDPKKNEKAATWLNRAKVYFESVQAPTKELFPTLDQMTLKMLMGDPQTATETELIYPWVKIYLLGNTIAWEQTKEIYPGAINVVTEALLEAHKLDPKQDSKIKAQIDNMVKFYRDLASVSFEIKRFDVAQDCYVHVCELESNPAFGTPDYENFFIAGQLSAFEGSNDKSKFVDGEKFMQQALDNGYVDENGDIYYFLFHCYYGQREQDRSKVMKAKDTLLEGIAKFPKNDKILDGLMSLYTAEEGVGNPADLIAMIDGALAEDPTNTDLWFGRGRVYYAIAAKTDDTAGKLNCFDECIKSFNKVVELKPDMFEANYFLSIFYQMKGDVLAQEVNSRDYKSQSEYDKDYQEVLTVYKEAVPWLEKSIEINPQNVDAVEAMKSLCFRLRDEAPEYMEKYTKYSEMLNALKQ